MGRGFDTSCDDIAPGEPWKRCHGRGTRVTQMSRTSAEATYIVQSESSGVHRPNLRDEPLPGSLSTHAISATYPRRSKIP